MWSSESSSDITKTLNY